MVLAWVKDYTAEKKIQLNPSGFSPGSKLKKFVGCKYLKIGKSFCCKTWSAGSHKTSNEYLRKKLEHLQKLGDQGDFFLNLNFHKILNFLFFPNSYIFVRNIIVLIFLKKMMYDTLTFFTIFGVKWPIYKTAVFNAITLIPSIFKCIEVLS